MHNDWQRADASSVACDNTAAFTESQDTRALGIDRRVALKLMGTGVLSVGAASLASCLPFGRTTLVEGLLKEKYNRSFVVTGKPYGFDWKSEPDAYCREAADEDGPAFAAAFNVARRELLGDGFVGRKLGRQAEEIITECFAKQGIAVAPNGGVNNAGDDPDITLEEYIAERTEIMDYSFNLVISDELETPRTNKRFIDAFIDVADCLKSGNAMRIYVVKEQDFVEFSAYLRAAPKFNSLGMPEGKVIDGFYAGFKNSEFKTREDNFWKQFAY